MNSRLELLHPYPFEKLRALFQGITPDPLKKEIKLSIGEPQHATPDFIKTTLANHLGGLASYPTTAGLPALRESIAHWIGRRYGITVNAEHEVLPVNGTREALFAFAQAVVDSGHKKPMVVSPNPFYQIYEGAALLGGAEPRFLNTLPEQDFELDLDRLTAEEWQRVQLMYVCSPGNPSGKVLSLDFWKRLFELSDRYGFVIASDECYSEIYFSDTPPPLGGLEAARQLGRGYDRLVMFSSLSKRSNVPGLRSGFVAGDAGLLKKFLLYRTYHGCAMSLPVQHASIAAWNDESHVVENRRLYQAKFDAITPIIQRVLKTQRPDAGFYLWAKVPGMDGNAPDDTEFTRRLYAEQNVVVLPGSFLARESGGINPGQGFVRLALVSTLEEGLEAASRIVDFVQSL